MSLTLSVLDQSPISEGMSGADALRNTLDLAQHVDRLGYSRYWVAEHHGTPMLASASPEALIGPIAAATSSQMRVGSGGVMLPHYSPLKVAETFSVLSGLYPGRIDLGVGRAPGTDARTTFALQRDRRQAMPDDFPDQLSELIAYLENDLPPEHPFASLGELPGRPETPALWLLGSSPQSALWAAQLGIGYSFADFINPGGAEIAAVYRDRFTSGERLPHPRVSVAVWAICADSDEEAQRLASSSRMTMTLLRQGRLIPVPPVERALRFLEQCDGGAPSRPDTRGGGRRAVIGRPEKVRAEIEELADAYGASEVMVVTITFDHEARRRSYELIAEAFGLEPHEPVAATQSA
jgi:luciferase family oxidoreductase group 1